MVTRIIRDSMVALALASAACSLVMDMNALQAGCPVGEKFCGTSCVGQNRSETGCGSDDCDPCSATGVERFTCSDAFECVPSRCLGGYKLCSEACVPADNPETGCAQSGCGPCDSTGGEPTCSPEGACTYTACGSSFKACNGTCVPTNSPTYGCANATCTGCSIAHAETYECVDGDCAPGRCATGYKDCGADGCKDVTDPEAGCGRTDCSPCYLNNVLDATCNASGACAPANCFVGFGNCDGLAENGCEVDMRRDKDHCGTCITDCDEQVGDRVATVSCASSLCRISTCDPGYANCDTNLGNGCETNILVSNTHCGGCGQPCSGTCTNGICE